MNCFSQSWFIKGLMDLDGLAGIDKFVDISWHRVSPGSDSSVGTLLGRVLTGYLASVKNRESSYRRYSRRWPGHPFFANDKGRTERTAPNC
jgi:hypothetical protein